MVEVILICKGTTPEHEFKKTFDGELNWSEINRWAKNPDPRCELHPDVAFCDWE
jgi:hypothetical protein